MNSIRQSVNLFSKLTFINLNKEQRRNVKISIIGGANETGSKLALLLKLNYKVSHIKLYDEEARVKGSAAELNQLPGGPKIIAYSGTDLVPAVCDSDLILMVSKAPSSQHSTKISILENNAPAVQAVCKAMASYNPNAFLALSTGPINSMVPFAAAFLYKHKAFNPFKLLGITQIDEARCKCLTGAVLKANPTHIRVPVIGGHSEETMIPLFSNLTPDFYALDSHQADMLTRLVKRAGNELSLVKKGKDSTIAMAWSINEFCKGLIDSILYGTQVELNCFAANPHFGTRYFAGPNIIGPQGIVQTPSNFKMSHVECAMLSDAVHALNKDVKLGEDLFAKLSGGTKYTVKAAINAGANAKPELVHNPLNTLG